MNLQVFSPAKELSGAAHLSVRKQQDTELHILHRRCFQHVGTVLKAKSYAFQDQAMWLSLQLKK